jgi:hypothetical protein
MDDKCKDCDFLVQLLIVTAGTKETGWYCGLQHRDIPCIYGEDDDERIS